MPRWIQARVAQVAAKVVISAVPYRSGEAWNESAYSNPDFDAKLEKALAMPDPKERKLQMKDLEK